MHGVMVSVTYVYIAQFIKSTGVAVGITYFNVQYAVALLIHPHDRQHTQDVRYTKCAPRATARAQERV